MLHILLFFTLAAARAEAPCAGHGFAPSTTMDFLNSESNIWRIETPRGDKGIIVGVAHTTNANTRAHYDAFKNVAYASDLYFPESDGSQKGTDIFQAGEKGGPDVRDRMTPEQKKLLLDVLASQGQSASDIEGKKPWSVFNLLLRPIGKGIDADLYEYMARINHPIVPLQTMEQVVSNLDGFPYGVETTLDTICSFAEAQTQIGDATVDFSKKDFHKLVVDLNRWTSVDPKIATALNKDLVEAVNVRMIDTLDKNLTGGKTFVSLLGFDHLPGKTGLLESLRARGWKVKPMQLDEVNDEEKNLEAKFVNDHPNLVPELVNEMKDDIHLSGTLPKLKFISRIEMYNLACGGYYCPLRSYFHEGTIYLMADLLPELVQQTPDGRGEIVRGLANASIESENGSHICVGWSVREIRANTVVVNYLAKHNASPTSEFRPGPTPTNCH